MTSRDRLSEQAFRRQEAEDNERLILEASDPTKTYIFRPREIEKALGDSAIVPENQAIPEVRSLGLSIVDQMTIALQTLPRRQRQVLELRFGLEKGDELTQQQTAQELGISRRTVRTHEERGLSRLRERKGAQIREYLRV